MDLLYIEHKNNNNNNSDLSNKIFEFCLIYYFNVILRITRRQEKTTNYSYFNIFKDIIRIYTENDINKAKYLLEEFCNEETINEFLIYCPRGESTNDCIGVLLNAFNVIYKKSIINSNDSFIYEFMNTLIIYIDNNIRKIYLDNVNTLLMNIITKGGNKFINYLKKKNFQKWVASFYGNRNLNYKNVINENVYPIIHSQHSILSDKLYKNIIDKKELNEENDIYDQHFLNKLNDCNLNKSLIEFLSQFFND